jgi:hypothetical protein
MEKGRRKKERRRALGAGPAPAVFLHDGVDRPPRPPLLWPPFAARERREETEMKVRI